MTAPVVNYGNLNLGRCQVEIPLNTPIGATLGGVKFKRSEISVHLKADQMGQGIAEIVFDGDGCEVEIPFAEVSKAMLAKVLPGTYLVIDAIDPTKMQLRGALNVGARALADSLTVQIVLKPIYSGEVSADPTDWIYIHKAIPIGDFAIAFDGTQQVYTRTFVGLPDSTKSNRRWDWGDPTAAS